MKKTHWHHKIARSLRDFHRREGAFTALAFGVLFLLGLMQVVGAQTQVSPQLHELSMAVSALTSDQARIDEYQVAKVIDGDTILLTNGEYVRYLGIDTPEIFPEVGCYALLSTARNRELVEGKTVRLIRDVSDRDRWGRWLRYVYVNDQFINQVLVEEGFATAVVYPPDEAHKADFLAGENTAQALELGRWKMCN